MHPRVLSVFTGELVKIGASKLRTGVKLMKTPKGFEMLLGGRLVGGAHLIRAPQHWQIKRTWVNPEFQGMGLGKKLYGEMMRRAPGRRVVSDAQVSEDAARVWRSMSRRPGYSVQTNPGARQVDAQTWGGPLPWDVSKGWAYSAPGYVGESSPVFRGRLPRQATLGGT